MSNYPGAIDEFRTTQNLPGILYDETDTSTIYAEDTNGANSAITAIENTLGINPQGDYPTVAARLSSAGGGGGAWAFVTEYVATGSETEIDIDTLDLATDEAYLIFWSIRNDYTTTAMNIGGMYAITMAVVGARMEGGTPDGQSGLYFLSHPSLGPGVGQMTIQKLPDGTASFEITHTIGAGRNYRMNGMDGNWYSGGINLTYFRVVTGGIGGFTPGSCVTVYKRQK